MRGALHHSAHHAAFPSDRRTRHAARPCGAPRQERSRGILTRALALPAEVMDVVTKARRSLVNHALRNAFEMWPYTVAHDRHSRRSSPAPRRTNATTSTPLPRGAHAGLRGCTAQVSSVGAAALVQSGSLAELPQGTALAVTTGLAAVGLAVAQSERVKEIEKQEEESRRLQAIINVKARRRAAPHYTLKPPPQLRVLLYHHFVSSE